MSSRNSYAEQSPQQQQRRRTKSHTASTSISDSCAPQLPRYRQVGCRCCLTPSNTLRRGRELSAPDAERPQSIHVAVPLDMYSGSFPKPVIDRTALSRGRHQQYQRRDEIKQQQQQLHSDQAEFSFRTPSNNDIVVGSLAALPLPGTTAAAAATGSGPFSARNTVPTLREQQQQQYHHLPSSIPSRPCYSRGGRSREEQRSNQLSSTLPRQHRGGSTLPPATAQSTSAFRTSRGGRRHLDLDAEMEREKEEAEYAACVSCNLTDYDARVQTAREAKRVPRAPILRRASIFVDTYDTYRNLVVARKIDKVTGDARRLRLQILGMDDDFKKGDVRAMGAGGGAMTEEETTERQETWLTLINVVNFIRMFSNATELVAMTVLRRLFAPVVRRVRNKIKRDRLQRVFVERFCSAMKPLTLADLKNMKPFETWPERILKENVLPKLQPAGAIPGTVIVSEGDADSPLCILERGVIEPFLVHKTTMLNKPAALNESAAAKRAKRNNTRTLHTFHSIRTKLQPQQQQRRGRQRGQSPPDSNNINLGSSGSFRRSSPLNASVRSANSNSTNKEQQGTTARNNSSDVTIKSLFIHTLQEQKLEPFSLHKDCINILAVMANTTAALNLRATEKTLFWKLSRQDYVDAIQKCSHEALRNCGRNHMFVPWSEDCLLDLIKQLQPVTVNAGGTLFKEGDVADQCYFICNGAADIFCEVATDASTGQQHRGGNAPPPPPPPPPQQHTAAAASVKQQLRHHSPPAFGGSPATTALTTNTANRKRRPSPQRKKRPQHPKYGAHVGTIIPWSSIGEESIVTLDRRMATLVARTELDAYVCDRSVLLGILSANPGVYLIVKNKVKLVKSMRLQESHLSPLPYFKNDPVLRCCGDATLVEIARRATACWLPTSDTLVRDTQLCAVFVVHSGTARLRITNNRRLIPEKTPTTLRSGAVVGSATTVRKEQWYYPFTYDASSPVEGWEIPHTVIYDCIREFEGSSQRQEVLIQKMMLTASKYIKDVAVFGPPEPKVELPIDSEEEG